MECQTKVVMLLIFATAVGALANDFDKVVKEQTVSGGNYANCPFGWVHYYGRCYLYQATKLDWASAENHCMRLGAHLVSIHSENENELVKALIRAYDFEENHTYIGLSGCQKAFNYFWSDGTTMTYTKWNPEQPDNSGGREGCVHITNHNYKNWNDIPCDATFPFVCAKTSD